MILVDTNIIIDYWKKPDERLTEIFQTEDIAICGVVQAELLHGARSENDIKRILEAISGFENLPFFENWSSLGTMLYKLRSSGLTLPFTDALIAQTAINHHVSILTKDNHFGLIKTVIPELELYSI